MEALEGMLDELPDYPLLIAPNKVPATPPASETNKLRRLVEGTPGVRVAPPVSDYRWLRTRKIRRAVTSYEVEPARVQPLAAEIRAVADAVRSYGRD